MKSHISTVCKNKIKVNTKNEENMKTIYNAVFNIVIPKQVAIPKAPKAHVAPLAHVEVL